jgi:CubicO group peptidase (beta-lactamase class C family)
MLALLATNSLADPVDDYVAAVMQEERIPGLAVLVVEGGKVTKMQGYGFANLEHQVAVTADTIFQSGSVGKQFTAMAVLQLAEAGRLAIDDPLARHFPGGPAAWHRITVRQLLAHTAGVRDYGPEFDYRRDYSEAELLDVASTLPIEFEPGSQWSYSNSGYMVLGVLISGLAGEHWSEFVAKNIFEPAGMETARVITEAGIVPHRAAGYERDAGGELRNQDWVAPPFNTQADGALYFSIRDLAAWDKALRGRKLMSSASYAAWWSPVELSGGYSYPYGFGWEITDQRGRRVVEHGGSWQGFRAYIGRYVENDVSIAVLANVSDADAERIGHEIAGRVDAQLLLPAPGDATDRHPDLVARLRAVLDAWSKWTVSPVMGEALAATRAGSPREASGRATIHERLMRAERLAFLGEDDVADRGLVRRGGSVQRIVYGVLETGDATYRYRFYLSADDRVLDFGEI